jgi:hypothetical protein
VVVVEDDCGRPHNLVGIQGEFLDERFERELAQVLLRQTRQYLAGCREQMPPEAPRLDAAASSRDPAVGDLAGIERLDEQRGLARPGRCPTRINGAARLSRTRATNRGRATASLRARGGRSLLSSSDTRSRTISS